VHNVVKETRSQSDARQTSLHVFGTGGAVLCDFGTTCLEIQVLSSWPANMTRAVFTRLQCRKLELHVQPRAENLARELHPEERPLLASIIARFPADHMYKQFRGA